VSRQAWGLTDRTNPLLYESDGSFNPGWLLFIAFSLAGLAGAAAAVAVALREAKAWPAAIAALVFLSVAMLITAIIVVPIARAKLLANSKTIGAGLKSMGAFAGVTFDTDERDESQRGDAR